MNGFVLYRGPSEIDGQPIICIATGLEDGGSNSKTGPMIQVYILRADMNPLVAAQTGDDASICGGCRHRGRVIKDPVTGLRRNVERSCYVMGELIDLLPPLPKAANQNIPATNEKAA